MNKNLFFKIAHILIAIAIFTYVFIRVFTIPVTTDESWTYISFVNLSVWDIITAALPYANNHILNTLLTKLTTTAGHHEFWLRLPNLVACAVYIYAANRLSGSVFTNKVLRLSFFVTLLTHYTLLDFFGLCRGYGLSIGLLMMSISFLYSYIQHHRTKHLHITLLTAVLAVYASFTLLYVVCIIFLLGAYIAYKNKLNLKPVVVYSLIGVLLCIYPMYRMYTSGELYYGGTIGFYTDTIFWFTADWWGHYFVNNNLSTTTISVTLLPILLVVTALIITKRIKTQLWLMVSLLFAVVLIINILFYTIGIRLPINRTGLYLYPLYVISIFSAIAILYKKAPAISIAVGLVLCLFSSYRFTQNMNYDNVVMWWHDMFTKDVLADISKTEYDTKASVFVLKDCYNSFQFYADGAYKEIIKLGPCCVEFDQLKNPDQYDYLFLHKHTDISAHLNFKKVKSYHSDSTFVLYLNTLTR